MVPSQMCQKGPVGRYIFKIFPAPAHLGEQIKN